MKKLGKLTLKELENSALVMQKQSQQAIVAGSGNDPYFGSGFSYQSNGGYGGFANPVSFNDPASAYVAATTLSCETQRECGGLVFADGTAVLYQSDKATYNTNIPLLPTNEYCIDGEDISVYNKNVIVSNFHTHPEGTNTLAGKTDRTTQSSYFPNCDMVILEGNNITTYHYEGGFLVP